MKHEFLVQLDESATEAKGVSLVVGERLIICLT